MTSIIAKRSAAVLLCTLTLWVFGAVAPVLPADKASDAAAATDTTALAERVVEHRLPNGLVLLMVERHRAPVVSVTITYKVGGVNERPGITGVAHFYEHLAFKGTKTLGTKDYRKEAKLLERLDRAWKDLHVERMKGDRADPEALAAFKSRFQDLEAQAAAYVVVNEIGEIYERNGAVGLNASTGKDLTRYLVSLPSNRLELWAAIESDRMAHSVLREFYKEKDVVLEERRLRYENSPSGRLYEAFLSAAFVAHPYGMPVIGWTSDLEALSRVQTENFFRAYYGPQNAVITIVGDIDPKSVIRLVEKTFGAIPAQAPSPEIVTVEPEQAGERRVQIEFDAEPSVIIGYHKPALDHPDEAVFDVIDSLLSEGRSSRLYRSLVKDRQIAVNVFTSTSMPGARYPNLFMIQAVPRAPHATPELEAAIDAELDRLKVEPVGPHELQKIINQLDAGMIRSLESNSGLASQLGYFQAEAGTWRYILDHRERIARVTAEDVMRVARKYFVKNNRVAAALVKKGK